MSELVFDCACLALVPMSDRAHAGPVDNEGSVARGTASPGATRAVYLCAGAALLCAGVAAAALQQSVSAQFASDIRECQDALGDPRAAILSAVLLGRGSVDLPPAKAQVLLALSDVAEECESAQLIDPDSPLASDLSQITADLASDLRGESGEPDTLQPIYASYRWLDAAADYVRRLPAPSFLPFFTAPRPVATAPAGG